MVVLCQKSILVRIGMILGACTDIVHGDICVLPAVNGHPDERICDGHWVRKRQRV